MRLRVKLQEIVEAMDLPNRDWQSHVNRVTVTDDMVIGPDEELNPEDVEEYLPLPTVSRSTNGPYEAAGPGYQVSVRTEPASGPVQEWSYTTTLDGED